MSRGRVCRFVATSAIIAVTLVSCVGDAPRSLGPTGSHDAASVDAASAEATVDAIATPTKDAAHFEAGCKGNPICERVIFATLNTRTGNLGGAAGADEFCTAEANAAETDPRVHGREFVAWASFVASTAAERHVHGTEPYVRPDGTQVAANWEALVGGTLEADVGQDQYRDVATGTAWTGTNPDGTRAPSNCIDFASPLETDIGGGGALSSTTSTWSLSAAFKCDSRRRLICIEK